MNPNLEPSIILFDFLFLFTVSLYEYTCKKQVRVNSWFCSNLERSWEKGHGLSSMF